MKKKLATLLLIPVLSIFGIFSLSTVAQADPLTCNMQTFSGEDDSAHQMNLPFSLYLGSTSYSVIYLTTNGTMTFGTPDANYWSYPDTPSVSLAGWDWVTWGEGAYVSYGYTSNSFCIEWSVRPFPQSTGYLTQIRLVVNKYSDTYWHGEIITFGWLPEGNRRGIRYESGQEVVLIEAAFDVNGGVPVEVEPSPQPTSFDDPVVVPSPTPTVEPTPEPTEEPTALPSSDPSPPSNPSESQSQPVAPDLTPSPTPEPQTSFPLPLIPNQVENLILDQDDSSSLPLDNSTTESLVFLENGVVLGKEVYESLQVFDNIDLFLAALITDPGKILEGLSNIGADMTPEQREESQIVVIVAIIAGQLLNGLIIANNIGRKL